MSAAFFTVTNTDDGGPGQMAVFLVKTFGL